MEHWWDDAGGKGKSTWRKTCFSATLCTINLTWAMGLNLGPCSDVATTKQTNLSKTLCVLMKDT